MDIPLFIVDAFTKEPFKGNQAGVCLLSEDLEDDKLQKIAFEMNLSETAFISVVNNNTTFDGSNEFKLRWFTPNTEIDLCGHATLASSHVIFTEMGNQNTKLVFHTRSGILSVSKELSMLVMDFPLDLAQEIDKDYEISRLLSLQDSDVIYCGYAPKLKHILIEVPEQHILQSMKPDFLNLLEYNRSEPINAVIVTCKMKNQKLDFASRFFGPWIAINEDPVTGASHTTLGPYWAKKLQKNHFFAIQLSERTGLLELELIGDRILIKGSAVTTLKGNFIL
jgi:PhzF family phenazine biosynthesis protein